MSEDRINRDVRKVWIIAGEESGDLYGSYLARELTKLSSTIRIEGMGGREMAKAGVRILVDASELGVVGFVEVVKKFGTFRRIFYDLADRALQEHPDLIILIDFPGFNVRLARKLCGSGIKIVYYVSPQVWAWGADRIPLLAKTTSLMLVIFPFETEIYRRVNLKTVFVGHPLVEIMNERRIPDLKQDANLVLLLPGSRDNEVSKLVEPLARTANDIYRAEKRYRFVMAVPRHAIRDRVQQLLDALKPELDPDLPLTIVSGETERYMQMAVAGIAASGTVTVQSAIYNLPLVVVYKLNPLTYLIGKLLVKTRYFTMVNLVAQEMIFEEFIQGDVNSKILKPALRRILPGGDRRKQAMEGMKDVVGRLSTRAGAGGNAARAILNEMV